MHLIRMNLISLKNTISIIFQKKICILFIIFIFIIFLGNYQNFYIIIKI